MFKTTRSLYPTTSPSPSLLIYSPRNLQTNQPQDDDDEDVHAGKIILKTPPNNIFFFSFQSMPKMPEGEKKEESAESLAEKKEQVIMFHLNCLCIVYYSIIMNPKSQVLHINVECKE